MTAPSLASYISVLQNSTGQIIPGATIIVLSGTTGGSEAVNTSTQPGTPLASIYSDPYGASPINQSTTPLVSDDLGNYAFWAAPGYYVLQIYGNGVPGQFVGGNFEPGQVIQGISMGAGGTGTFTNISVQNLETILFADQFAGTDLGQKLNNAFTAMSGTPGEVWVNHNAGLTLSTPVNVPTGCIIRFIQGGTYNLSATISMGLGSALIGTPTGNLYNLFSGITHLYQTSSSNLSSMITLNGTNINSVLLQDISVDGNASGNASAGPNILFNNTGNGFHILRNVTSRNSNSHGFSIGSGSGNNGIGTVIDGGTFINNTGNGIYLNGVTDIFIRECQIENNTLSGIGGAADSIRVDQCDISGNLKGIGATGTSSYASETWMVQGTQFGNNLQGDIVLTGTSNNYCLNWTINGCVFDGLGSGSTNNTYDAVHSVGGGSLSVTGCLFVSQGSSSINYRYGIYDDSGNTAASTFTGNVFNGTYGTSAYVLAGSSIANNNTVAGAQTPITARNIENILYADQFAGSTADVKINAAISALPSAGGIVDCRGFGTTTQTIAGQITVGSTSKCVTLIMGRATNYQVTINNSSLSAFLVNPGSAIIGDAECQTTANEGTITLTSGSSVNCVIDLVNEGGSYSAFEISNLQINCGGSAATIATAGVRLTNPLQIGTMRGVTVYNFYNTTGLLITETTAGSGGGAGPINLYNLQIDGDGLTGAHPVKIVGISSGGVMGNFNFFGGTFAHPGTGGIAIIDCEGITGNELAGANFYGCNLESINTADIGFLINNCTGINIHGAMFTDAGSAGTACVKITGSNTDGITVTNINNFDLWTNNVVNTINSDTITNSSPRLPWYSYMTSTRNHAVWDNAAGTTAKITGIGVQSLGAIFTAGTPTVSSGQVGFGNSTATTATSGSATLPGNPLGFLTINISGTMVKIPYYSS